MPIYNLTFEKIQELEKQNKEKETEYEELKEKSEEDIWLEELDYLQTKYKEWLVSREAEKSGKNLSQTKTTKKKK